MREKKITRVLWHEFTGEEERAVGQALVQTIAKHQEVRDRKQAAMKGFNEEIADLESETAGLAMKLRAHGEQQPVECIVHFHKPTVAAKEVFRADTGEKIAEEAMTPDECQEHLFAATPEKAEGASA
jgi:hypothetical protein